LLPKLELAKFTYESVMGIFWLIDRSTELYKQNYK